MRVVLSLTFNGRLRMRQLLKCRIIFFVFLLIFATIACVFYVPYDFTISTLASIYVRCSASKTPFLEQLDNSGVSANCQNSERLIKDISKRLTSKPPWIGVYNRRMIAYSAYFVEKSNLVRVLVLKHTNECRPVLCYFRQEDGDSLAIPGLLKGGQTGKVLMSMWAHITRLL